MSPVKRVLLVTFGTETRILFYMMYVFKERPANHWRTATVFIINNRINYGDSGLSHCAAAGKLLVNGGEITIRETVKTGTTGDLLGFMLVFC